MNIEERVQIAILTKYYGKLLTTKQQNIISMYVDNNLSLAEVAEELKISRQAVKDSLDKTYNSLTKFEKDLQFILRDDKIKKILNEELPEKAKEKILSILED